MKKNSDRYFKGLMKDYRGLMLCCQCWNLLHYDTETDDSNKVVGKISLCEDGGCQCPCREILTEKHPRKKRVVTMDLPLDGIIEEIGPRS